MLYHKIHTIFKRDEDGKILIGNYSKPEFEYLENNIWVMTEKVDGTNIRFEYDGYAIKIGGKTENSQIPLKLLEVLLNYKDKLSLLMFDLFQNKQVTLFGEGFGCGIQKNGDHYGDLDFTLFDINVDGTWLNWRDVRDIGNKLGLKIVPIVTMGTLEDAIRLCINGFDSYLKSSAPEGLVLRTPIELRTNTGERIITKLKLKDF